MLFDILHSYNIKHIVQLPDIESMIYIYIYILKIRLRRRFIIVRLIASNL